MAIRDEFPLLAAAEFDEVVTHSYVRDVALPSGRTLALKVRYADLTARSTQLQLPHASDDEYVLIPHLLRMLQAAGQQAPEVKPILEINPEHALLARMNEAADADFQDWSQLLLEQAMLAEGATLDDPAAFVKRMNKLLLG